MHKGTPQVSSSHGLSDRQRGALRSNIRNQIEASVAQAGVRSLEVAEARVERVWQEQPRQMTAEFLYGARHGLRFVALCVAAHRAGIDDLRR